MPAKTVEVVITGKNAQAIAAINQVGTAAEKNAKKGADAFDKSASKVGSSFSKLGSLGASFGVPFSTALGAIGTKLEDSGKKTESFGKKLEHIGDTVAVGAAAGLAIVGGAAVKAALEGEASQARIETAVKNAGAAYSDYSGKIDATAKHMADFGFENDQVNDAIARLIPATHNVQKAIDLMGLAADIAAARHINLSDATDILVKVEAGRYGQLIKSGIVTKEQAAGFKTTDDAVKALTATYKGSAAAAADTYAGKLAAVSAKVSNLEEDLGNKLLPVVADVVSGISRGIDMFESFNSTLDGVPGKLVAVGAAAAGTTYLAVKLVGAYNATADALGPIIGKFLGKTAAEEADAAATAQSAAATGAKTAALESEAAAAGTTTTAIEGVTAAETGAGVAGGGAFAGIAAGALPAAAAIGTLGAAFGEAKMEQRAKEAGGLSNAINIVATSTANTIPGLGVAKGALGLLGIGFGDSGKKADKLTEAQNKLADAQKKLIDLETSGTATDSQLADARGKVTAAASELLPLQVRQAAAQKDTNAATQDATGAATDNTQATQDQKLSVADLVGVLEKAKIGFDNEVDGQQRAEASTQSHDDAVQALAQHLKDLNDLTLGAANTEIQLQQANLRVGDSETKLTDAIKEHGYKSKEAQSAQLDLNSSVLSAVGAAEQNVEAIDNEKKAHGENISAVQIENDKHAAAYAELQGLKGQYPALSGLIDGYINKLGLIPPTRSTTVTANVQYNVPPLHISVPNIAIGEITYTYQGHPVSAPVYQSPRARGGPVDPNTAYLVGEEGPELFVPKRAGGIVPNDRLNAYTPGSVPSAAMNMSPVVNITVRNETHVDPVTGRTIHRLVQEDQSRNGPWKIRIRA